MAWIRDNLAVFWPRAEELYRSHGRGAFVADTTWQSLDGSMPLGYFPQSIFEQDLGSNTLRMVQAYHPSEEFVMVLLKNHNRESSYRVRVRRREAEDTALAQDLQHVLHQTLEQHDGVCLDEEAERQVLAAILSSVITDLLGEDLAFGGTSRPLNGKPGSPAATP